MIDAQEFGAMQAELLAQRRDLDRMARSCESMAESIKAMQSQMAEARGGWRVMLMVGGASATFGAVIAKAAAWWASIGHAGPGP